MPRIPPLLAGSLLTGAIATATAVAWICTTGRLTPAGILICALASVALSFATEAAVREIHRRRRAPLIRRWTTSHRKPRPRP